jgi:UDP-glucuronate 4-epimerase
MAIKKILVTGSAGFIGFHLCCALKRRGDLVIGYDNFNTYYSVELKKARALQLEQVGIPTLHADICDTHTLRKCLDENAITHVVHLAAQAGVRYSLENPDSYVKSNLNGFVQILEALRAKPDIPLIYASSSSVYGLNTKVPFSETDPTDQPASFYGATKKSNEVIAHAYHHTFHIPMTGLRFFSVYGPWGRPDMAYYSFTKAILEGKPINVYSGSTVKRDFTYIDDIIEGTIHAIDRCSGYQVVNLGNHQPESVDTLISILENLLGKKAIRNEMPLPLGDAPITYADLTKSRQLLDYQPRTQLAQGLEQFVKWYLSFQCAEIK